MKIIKISSPEKDILKIKEAAKLVYEGHLVAFPTETVYGIAANAENPNAVEKLIKIKRRPQNKPFTYHFGSYTDFLKFENGGAPEIVKKIAREILPAPLTIVYYDEKRNKKIGIRIPNHEIACLFLKNCGCPVFAPSANPSGMESPTNTNKILKYFKNDELTAIIDAGTCPIGKSSTVIEIVNEKISVLRKGSYPEKDIYNLLKKQ